MPEDMRQKIIIVTDDKELRELIASLDKLSATGKKAATEVDKSMTKATRSMTKGGRAAQMLRKGLSQLPGILGRIASVGPAAIFGAMFVALGHATRQAARFEKEMAEVATLVDTNSISMATLNQQLLDLAKISPVNIDDLTQGLYQLISAGVEATRAVDVLDIAMRSAVGGVTDVETAIDGITSVLNAWNLEASEATAVADTFFVAVRNGKTTFAELSNSIGTVAPIAGALGVTFDEVAAAVTTLTQAGVRTNLAMTQLRSLLVAVARQVPQTAKVARELGVAFTPEALREKGLARFLQETIEAAKGNNTQITKLVGRIEALNAIVGLTGIRSAAFNDNLEDMTRKAGSTELAFQKMSKTALNLSAVIANKVKAAFIELGLDVLPWVNARLQDLIDLFGEVGTDAERSLATLRKLGFDDEELKMRVRLQIEKDNAERELDDAKESILEDADLRIPIRYDIDHLSARNFAALWETFWTRLAKNAVEIVRGTLVGIFTLSGKDLESAGQAIIDTFWIGAEKGLLASVVNAFEEAQVAVPVFEPSALIEPGGFAGFMASEYEKAADEILGDDKLPKKFKDLNAKLAQLADAGELAAKSMAPMDAIRVLAEYQTAMLKVRNQWIGMGGDVSAVDAIMMGLTERYKQLVAEIAKGANFDTMFGGDALQAITIAFQPTGFEADFEAFLAATNKSAEEWAEDLRKRGGDAVTSLAEGLKNSKELEQASKELGDKTKGSVETIARAMQLLSKNTAESLTGTSAEVRKAVFEAKDAIDNFQQSFDPRSVGNMSIGELNAEIKRIIDVIGKLVKAQQEMREGGVGDDNAMMRSFRTRERAWTSLLERVQAYSNSLTRAANKVQTLKDNEEERLRFMRRSDKAGYNAAIQQAMKEIERLGEEGKKAQEGLTPIRAAEVMAEYEQKIRDVRDGFEKLFGANEKVKQSAAGQLRIFQELRAVIDEEVEADKRRLSQLARQLERNTRLAREMTRALETRTAASNIQALVSQLNNAENQYDRVLDQIEKYNEKIAKSGKDGGLSAKELVDFRSFKELEQRLAEEIRRINRLLVSEQDLAVTLQTIFEVDEADLADIDFGDLARKFKIPIETAIDADEAADAVDAILDQVTAADESEKSRLRIKLEHDPASAQQTEAALDAIARKQFLLFSAVEAVLESLGPKAAVAIAMIRDRIESLNIADPLEVQFDQIMTDFEALTARAEFDVKFTGKIDMTEFQSKIQQGASIAEKALTELINENDFKGKEQLLIALVNALKELREQAVDADKSFQNMIDTLDAIGKMLGAFEKVIGNIEGISGAVRGLISDVGSLVSSLGSATQAFQQMAEARAKGNAVTSAMKLGAAASVLTVVATGADALLKFYKSRRAEMKRRHEEWKRKMLSLERALGNAALSFKEGRKEEFTGGLVGSELSLQDLNQALAGIASLKDLASRIESGALRPGRSTIRSSSGARMFMQTPELIAAIETQLKSLENLGIGPVTDLVSQFQAYLEANGDSFQDIADAVQAIFSESVGGGSRSVMRGGERITTDAYSAAIQDIINSLGESTMDFEGALEAFNITTDLLGGGVEDGARALIDILQNRLGPILNNRLQDLQLEIDRNGIRAAFESFGLDLQQMLADAMAGTVDPLIFEILSPEEFKSLVETVGDINDAFNQAGTGFTSAMEAATGAMDIYTSLVGGDAAGAMRTFFDAFRDAAPEMNDSLNNLMNMFMGLDLSSDAGQEELDNAIADLARLLLGQAGDVMLESGSVLDATIQNLAEQIQANGGDLAAMLGLTDSEVQQFLESLNSLQEGVLQADEAFRSILGDAKQALDDFTSFVGGTANDQMEVFLNELLSSGQGFTQGFADLIGEIGELDLTTDAGQARLKEILSGLGTDLVAGGEDFMDTFGIGSESMREFLSVLAGFIDGGLTVDVVAAANEALGIFTNLLGNEGPAAFRFFIDKLLEGGQSFGDDLTNLLEQAQGIDLTTQQGQNQLNAIIATIGQSLLRDTAQEDFGVDAGDLEAIANQLKSLGEASFEGGFTSSASIARTITEIQGNEVIILLNEISFWIRQMVKIMGGVEFEVPEPSPIEELRDANKPIVTSFTFESVTVEGDALVSGDVVASGPVTLTGGVDLGEGLSEFTDALTGLLGAFDGTVVGGGGAGPGGDRDAGGGRGPTGTGDVTRQDFSVDAVVDPATLVRLSQQQDVMMQRLLETLGSRQDVVAPEEADTIVGALQDLLSQTGAPDQEALTSELGGIVDLLDTLSASRDGMFEDTLAGLLRGVSEQLDEKPVVNIDVGEDFADLLAGLRGDGDEAGMDAANLQEALEALAGGTSGAESPEELLEALRELRQEDAGGIDAAPEELLEALRELRQGGAGETTLVSDGLLDTLQGLLQQQPDDAPSATQKILDTLRALQGNQSVTVASVPTDLLRALEALRDIDRPSETAPGQVEKQLVDIKNHFDVNINTEQSVDRILVELEREVKKKFYQAFPRR